MTRVTKIRVIKHILLYTYAVTNLYKILNSQKKIS